MGIKSFISEPDRGRRCWKDKHAERDAVYANRRRIRSERGKSWMKKRGELIERSFAHCLETGAMRRTWLRGHEKIRKRCLVHVAAFNLSLVMRSLLGAGTPRGLADRVGGLGAAARGLIEAMSNTIRDYLRFLTSWPVPGILHRWGLVAA